MHPLFEAFVPALLLPAFDLALVFFGGIAGKATVILVVAFVAACLLRRASAALRHLVWSATVVCLVLLPLASIALPDWHVALPASSQTPWTALSGPGQPATAGANSTVTQRPKEAAPAVSESGSSRISTIVIAVWAVGFLVVAVRMRSGVRKVSAMARSAQELKAHEWSTTAAQLASLIPLGRRVPLLRSKRVSIPMTAGVRRPVILLPEDAGQWTTERRWVVLAHELLHVRRGDYCLWMIARLSCALYWFHPLAWLAAARLRKEAEQACDDGVLRLGADAPAYAEHLVSLARGWSLARTAELSAVAMAQPSHLESRIRALLDSKRNRREVSGRGRLIIGIAAVLMLAPLAAVRAPAQAAASLQGSISDSSGARLPGAFVSLKLKDSQSKAVTIADDAGEFAFASLPAGDYVVEVRKPGFRLHNEDVALAAGDHESVGITVNVGSIVEEILVVGKSPAQPEQSRPSRAPRRIRVGGNVQKSKLLTQVQPIYPQELQREGVEGMVVFEAVILTDGSLGNLRLANDLVEVDERLVDAAREAIRFWRYQPTLLNGEPVEVVTSITVSFRLDP